MRSLRAAVCAAVLVTTQAALMAQTFDWHDPSAVARVAAESQPAVRRIEAEVRAARERATRAGAYPNPMLMAGIRDLQVDLTQDEMMTMVMVGASQTIPRRSRRAALRSAAELDVQRIELEAASVRAEARRDALFAWYDIAAADSRITSLREVAGALESLVQTVRARYEAGSGIQADIIRASLQKSEVDHQILSATGKRRTAAARLAALLGFALTTEVPALHLPHATERRGIDQRLEIPSDHPVLSALRTGIERSEKEVVLARLLARPDVDVEASYGLRFEEKDVFSVVARMELPLRRSSTIEPRIREAIAEREALTARIEEQRRALLVDLATAFEAHADAARQLEFHENVLVPQSRLAAESTRAAYEGGKTPIDAVLAAEAAYLRLGTDYYDFLAQHIKAIVDFEAIQQGARSGAIAAAGMGSSMRSADTIGAPMPVSGVQMGMR